MAHKSSFLFFWLLFLTLSLSACAAKTSTPPVEDQNKIATSVAATIEAASTATQRAMPAKQTPAEITPILPTTQLIPATPIPTAPASPTPMTALDPSLQVAYINDGDIYLWNPRHGSGRLTDSHDVVDLRLSDDGTLIAYKRQARFSYYAQELWEINTDGAPNPRVLVSSVDLLLLKPPDLHANVLGYGVLSFTWRPNTHQLAYNTLVLHEGPGFGPNYDVRLVDADTSDKTTLIDTGQGGIFYYSPDGSQIALSNPESISLINADGSNLRSNLLTFPSVITYSEYEYHPQPIWAQDSSSLRVTIPPRDPLADPLSLTGLWMIPVDGSPAVLLGSVPAMPFAWPDNAFSPDLKHVGYASPSASRESNLRALHISDPDATHDTLYDQGESLEFISWAPDSLHFIYLINRGSNEGLYIGGLNQPPLKVVADPHLTTHVQWVNGSHFAYFLSNNNQWELHIYDIEANDLALIDTVPDSNPVFDLLP